MVPRNKMIKKACPKCSQQVAVASKTCRCGHSFASARKSLPATVVSSPPDPLAPDLDDSAEGIGEGIVKRRRTERVKREKPNYYDALEYEKQMKKRQRTRNRSTGSLEGAVEPAVKKEEASTSSSQPQLKRKRRGRVKVERDVEEEPVVTTMSPVKSLKCGVILAELNRKIGAVSWRI